MSAGVVASQLLFKIQFLIIIKPTLFPSPYTLINQVFWNIIEIGEVAHNSSKVE